MIQQAVLLCILGISAYQDCRSKTVCFPFLAASGLLGGIFLLCSDPGNGMDMLLGAGIGGIVLLLSFITRESIGRGDGLMLMVSGVFLGAEKNLELFFAALLLCGMAALFLIVMKRKERTCRIPLAPYLLAGYLFVLWGG